MSNDKPFDITLFTAVLGICVIGLIMIISTSSIIGYQNYNDSYFFIKRHIVFLIIGFAALVGGYRLDLTLLKKWAIPGFMVASLLLVLPFVKGVGVHVYGASRWIDLGFFQLQPVEVVKFAIIILVAVFMENKKAHLHHFMKGIVPLGLLLLVPIMILFLQPDMGNIMLIFFVTFSMVFLNKIPLKFLGLLVSAASIIVSISLMMNPYQLERIFGFLDPWADPQGKSYHIVQSLISIGSGGFWGFIVRDISIKILSWWAAPRPPR